MGHNNSKQDRRTACQYLDCKLPKMNTPAVAVTMKSMPQYPLLNITQIQICIERKIESTLYDGQKMEITFRSCPQNQKNKNSNKAQLFNYSLRCGIYKKNDSYIISFPYQRQKHLVWKFVREWTEFKEKDIIKLGNTQYRLQKFVTQNNQANIKQNSDSDFCESSSVQRLQQCCKSCKICFSSKQTPNNPFISPCRCMGSLQFTHLKCLSKWIFSLNIKEDDQISIKINKFICEICRIDISGTPEYEQMQKYILSDMNNVPPPYAIMQNLCGYQKKTSNFFILSFQKKLTYSIGRSSKADVIDKNDRCISKIHSQIKFVDNKLMVRDCESLHGTMMNLNGPLTLNQDNPEGDVIFRNMLIKAVYVHQALNTKNDLSC